MKKIIALALAMTMALAGCGQATESEAPAENAEATSDLTSAKDYIAAMYRNAPATHVEDYKVVGKVMVGTTSYDVEWTADSETVKFSRGDDNMVTVDIDEKNPEEVVFNLIATIKDAEGNAVSVSFAQKVPAAIILEGLSYSEIVENAYKLEDGLSLNEEMRLFGKVVKIDTPYSEEYKNITVTIEVAGLVDKPIQCFRLSGEGVADLKEGDEITVKGTLKNYKGTIEFDKGCQFMGLGEHIDQSAVVNAAYKLEDGMEMPNATVVKGVISKIDTPFSAEYNNITVTIVVDGMEENPIQCFRLSGSGADKLAEGDEIAVAGKIKNYKGTIEFDKGCKLVPAESFMDARSAVAAYALEDGMSMTAPSTITGVVASIDTEYSAEYKNITVTIVSGGLEDYKIQCFRLSGEGADTIAVGDTLTVTGTLKNYKGTIEFDKGCTFVKA